MKRFFQLLFAPCEGITGLVSESLETDLTRPERLAVWIHLRYCKACRHFRKHVHELRDALRETDSALTPSASIRLSPEARARISDSLEERGHS